MLPVIGFLIIIRDVLDGKSMPPVERGLRVNFVSRQIRVRLDPLLSKTLLQAEQLVLEVNTMRHDISIHLELIDRFL